MTNELKERQNRESNDMRYWFSVSDILKDNTKQAVRDMVGDMKPSVLRDEFRKRLNKIK